MEPKLKLLANCSVQISDNNSYPEEGHATINITFSNGAYLRADYWRLVKDGKQVLSSFDHGQKYGLPAPINAKTELRNALDGKFVQEAKLDKSTGDLVLYLNRDIVLQVFNFTGYEVWDFNLPDGTTEYSNYNR